MVIDIPKDKNKPILEVHLAKLSFKIRVISLQLILIPTKWRDMSNDDKNHAMERPKVRAKY